ncbi:MAG: hypothetical protein Fur002_02420 [Anaerolineales bacterium]
MKTPVRYLVGSVLLGMLILSACGGGAAPKSEAPAVYEEALAPQAEALPMDKAGGAAGAPMATAMPPVENAAPVSAENPSAGRMIIKSAEIKLLVEDTDIAINLATQAVSDTGGYIVSSRAWYQAYYDGNNYKYATITIGVPVMQFERMLNKLRGMSVKVLDESASGEDVSDQFVDLQSQVVNLEATRDRIKSFLDDAKTVDEALRINQELSNVEAQIEQLKGQMNYLQDRSAYSTITVSFEPKLPEVISTPTPTPTPQIWNPGETFENASKTVTSAYQGIVDFLIWLLVVIVPIFAPPVLIVWGVWKLLTKKR